MTLPSQWFSKRRGLATGITVSGTGFGGGFGSLIMRGILPRLGYQNSLLVSLFCRPSPIANAHTLCRASSGLRRHQCVHVHDRLVPARNEETPCAQSASEFRHEDGPPARHLERRSVLLPVRLRFRRSVRLPHAALARHFHLCTSARITSSLTRFTSRSYLTAFTTDQCPELDPNSLAPSVPLIVSNFTLGIGRVFSGFLADLFGPVNCLFFSFFAGVRQELPSFQAYSCEC